MSNKECPMSKLGAAPGITSAIEFQTSTSTIITHVIITRHSKKSDFRAFALSLLPNFCNPACQALHPPWTLDIPCSTFDIF